MRRRQMRAVVGITTNAQMNDSDTRLCHLPFRVSQYSGVVVQYAGLAKIDAYNV